MPFGLNISGSEFQKCIDYILGPLLHTFEKIYVDDIIITSESIEEHYEHIYTVLDKFKQHNITVNLEKSQFFRTEVKFLGHIISEKGTYIDQEKIETIKKF